MALQDVLASETMTESLTPEEAARVLATAARYEDSLQRRTEGLTWMIWGLATPGIFVTYAFASVLAGPGWWMGLLWVPWVVGGVLATSALWRSAALASPRLHAAQVPGAWLRGALWAAAVSAVFFVLRPDGPEIPLILVGALWAGMGILDVWRSSTAGRIAALTAGLPLVALGAAFAVFDAPIEVTGTVGMVLPGVLPFAVGSWLLLRG